MYIYEIDKYYRYKLLVEYFKNFSSNREYSNRFNGGRLSTGIDVDIDGWVGEL